MKLPKTARRRLYEASGKPILVTWPVDAPPPRKGKRYPVHNEEGNKAFQIRVEGRKGDKALVRIDADPFRPMFGLAGQRNDAGDYESEPERVSAEYEARRALEGRTKTGILGAEHRLAHEQLQDEARLVKGKASGQEKTVKTLERVQRAA